MKRHTELTAAAGALAFMLILVGYQAISVPPELAPQDGHAKIFPDYDGVTLPPNIAPLNFMIEEDAEAYRVILKSKNGNDIARENRSGRMRFPRAAWKKLLANNRGEALEIHISIKKAGQWRSFQPIVNPIAAHDIDSHLSYRLFNSVYTRWSEMGIYQRHLES
ncbi:hypothetical protein JXA02_08710, partial [candidate division KSB1 bacterium]